MRLALASLLALALAAPALGQGRFQQFTKKFARAADQAQVVGAGYLGGSGTEWLVGGGFQPDGTVVVVGVTLGPKLEIGGAKVAVLGTDAPAPKAPEPTPKKDKKGEPAKDKQGNVQYEPFAWSHANATAFVARLSPDLKQVRSVVRLPWASGGATSAAIDKDGNIYIAGPARDGIAALGKVDFLKTSDSGLKAGDCDAVYLCKLTPAADKIVWVARLAGKSDAPSVRLTTDGKLQFQSADLRVLTRDGRQESLAVVPGGITTKMGRTNFLTTAVSPRDGTIVKAGEHHWNTKREPYRDPILNIHRPDGKLLYELYNWDGPYVGLDNLRLVSDSAIRRVRFDEDGNLVMYAWSDGGNSVMYREPNDVRRVSKKMDGLGMSAWGAGVLSCAYLIKIEPKDYKVAGGTLWLAYLADKDKPNSIWIDALGFAADGSICIGGRSAYGLIQTANAIGAAEPTGPYVSVLSKDCSSLRFSSALPATARVDVRDGETWGFASGTVKGRSMMLFAGSAGDGAPAHGAVSAKFGGGHSDGYLVVLDLSK